MAHNTIGQNELNKYWDIFSSYDKPDPNYLEGEQAAKVFKNSGLQDSQLERIWDLADIDSDGKFDFAEFCVAMRLTFDYLREPGVGLPRTLPDWLVPSDKAHFVLASRGISGGHVRASVLDEEDDDDGPSGLKDGFDWSYGPDQRRAYDEVYTRAKDGHGYVERRNLQPFFNELDLPETDINSAWNLINPNQDAAIGKDATLYLAHVLIERYRGFRIPRRAPASLVHSFQNQSIDYNVDHVRNKAAREMSDDQTSTGRKAKFGDTYLSRLGIGNSGGYKPRGTDFGNATTDDWREVQLKQKLQDIEKRIQNGQAAKEKRESRAGRGDSTTILVRGQLEQMEKYKKRYLQELMEGGGKSKESAGMQSVADDIATIRAQVTGLEDHLARRKGVLDDLQSQIATEKAH